MEAEAEEREKSSSIITLNENRRTKNGGGLGTRLFAKHKRVWFSTVDKFLQLSTCEERCSS